MTKIRKRFKRLFEEADAKARKQTNDYTGDFFLFEINWKWFFSGIFVVSGVSLLILSFFAGMMLLLNGHGAGFFELKSIVGFLPFFVWGEILLLVGIVVFILLTRHERRH